MRNSVVIVNESPKTWYLEFNYQITGRSNKCKDVSGRSSNFFVQGVGRGDSSATYPGKGASGEERIDGAR